MKTTTPHFFAPHQKLRFEPAAAFGVLNDSGFMVRLFFRDDDRGWGGFRSRFRFTDIFML